MTVPLERGFGPARGGCNFAQPRRPFPSGELVLLATMTKKPAIVLMVLSLCVLPVGNFWLATISFITGAMALSPSTMRRSPDLIYMLSFLVAVSAGMFFFTVMPLGMYLIASTPHHVCSVSKAMVDHFKAPVASYPSRVPADVVVADVGDLKYP